MQNTTLVLLGNRYPQYMHTCPAAMCTVWSVKFKLSNHSYVHPTTTCSTHHFSLPHPTNSPSYPLHYPLTVSPHPTIPSLPLSSHTPRLFTTLSLSPHTPLPPHCPSHPTRHTPSLPSHCLPTLHYPLTARLTPRTHPTDPLTAPHLISSMCSS